MNKVYIIRKIIKSHKKQHAYYTLLLFDRIFFDTPDSAIEYMSKKYPMLKCKEHYTVTELKKYEID